MENEGMKSNEQDYSSWVYCIFVLLIFSGVGRSISKLTSALAFGNVTIGLLTLLCEIINVGFFIAMLNKKKWGLFAFIVMMLLQIPLNYLLGCNDMGQVYLSVLVRIAVLFLVLLIPNEGIPAWKTLLGDDFFRRHVTVSVDPKSIPQSQQSEGVVEKKDPMEIISETADENVGGHVHEPEPSSVHCMRQRNDGDTFVKSMQVEQHQKSSKPHAIWVVVSLTGILLVIALIAMFWPSSKDSHIIFFYGGDGMAHLDSKCEKGLFYISAPSVFGDLARSEQNQVHFCSKCIREKQFEQIRDSVKYYARFNTSEEYRYTKHIKEVWELLSEEYDLGNIIDFTEQLKNPNYRSKVFDVVPQDHRAYVGRDLNGFYHYLYDGYALFRVNSVWDKYIPVNEVESFKMVWPLATQYSIKQ